MAREPDVTLLVAASGSQTNVRLFFFKKFIQTPLIYILIAYKKQHNNVINKNSET